MSNFDEAKLNLYNLMVDLLVDMADPSEDEEEETFDDMRAVVSVLFEAVDLTIVSVDGGTLTATLEVD